MRSLFVNLPVADVAKTVAFFEQLGFSFDPDFASPHSACLVVNEAASVMCTQRNAFDEMIPGATAEPGMTEMVLSLACDSAAQVREIAERAFALGGRQVNDFEDHGFMVSWAFEDLDGHLWDLFWMNPAS